MALTGQIGWPLVPCNHASPRDSPSQREEQLKRKAADAMSLTPPPSHAEVNVLIVICHHGSTLLGACISVFLSPSGCNADPLQFR